MKELILDFILPHAFEFYRTADTVTGGDRIQRIASWIVTSGVKGGHRAGLDPQCHRHARSGLTRHLRSSIAPSRRRMAGSDQRGPENTKWRVTPAVARQFDERKRQEERRKTEVARLMNSSRKSGCR